MFLVYLFGFILALWWLSRVPRSAVLVLLGILLMLVSDLVYSAALHWVPRYMLETIRVDFEDLQVFFLRARLGHHVAFGFGLLLVFLAAFFGRSKATGRRPVPRPTDVPDVMRLPEAVPVDFDEAGNTTHIKTRPS